MYVYTCSPEWPEPVEETALRGALTRRKVALKSRVLFVSELFYYTLTRPSVVAALFCEKTG